VPVRSTIANQPVTHKQTIVPGGEPGFGTPPTTASRTQLRFFAGRPASRRQPPAESRKSRRPCSAHLTEIIPGSAAVSVDGSERFDLPRNSQLVALTGDPRNDENPACHKARAR